MPAPVSLIAEASRPDGFQVLSLGYAEGPEEYHLKDTLFDKSEDGLDILMEDMNMEVMGKGVTHVHLHIVIVVILSIKVVKNA